MYILRLLLYIYIKIKFKPDFIFFLNSCGCKLVAQETLVFIAYVGDLTCRSIYVQYYLQKLSNLTLCIMETLNLSSVYADRKAMMSACPQARLRLPCPLDCTSTCIIYLQPYS